MNRISGRTTVPGLPEPAAAMGGSVSQRMQHVLREDPAMRNFADIFDISGSPEASNTQEISFSREVYRREKVRSRARVLKGLLEWVRNDRSVAPHAGVISAKESVSDNMTPCLMAYQHAKAIGDWQQLREVIYQEYGDFLVPQAEMAA